MVQKKKPASSKKRKPKKRTAKRFRFQFGLRGVAGVAVVLFCLFLWMFLLGIWAGQTILLPDAPSGNIQSSSAVKGDNPPVKILKPSGREKKAVP